MKARTKILIALILAFLIVLAVMIAIKRPHGGGMDAAVSSAARATVPVFSLA